MKGGKKTWRSVDKKWRWMMPGWPYLRGVFPDIARRAGRENPSPSRVIELVCEGTRKMAASLLRKNGWRATSLAHDIAQESLARIAEKDLWASWRAEKGTPRALFVGILVNVTRELLRREIRMPESLDSEPVDEERESPDQTAHRKERTALMWEWISALPKDRQDALLRKYFATNSDIECDHLSKGREYVNRSRAMKVLRQRAMELEDE